MFLKVKERHVEHPHEWTTVTLALESYAFEAGSPRAGAKGPSVRLRSWPFGGAGGEWREHPTSYLFLTPF